MEKEKKIKQETLNEIFKIIANAKMINGMQGVYLTEHIQAIMEGEYRESFSRFIDKYDIIKKIKYIKSNKLSIKEFKKKIIKIIEKE